MAKRLSPRNVDAADLKQFKYFDWFLVSFVTVLLVSNIIGPKLVSLGPWTIAGVTVGPMLLGAAQVLFPFSYIFGDVFTEVYGYAASRKAIWSGFFASLLMVIFSQTILWLPPAPQFKDQAAFETVLSTVPRFVAASLIAYWCGEFANSFVMAKMKVLTKGRMLWTRTIGSTAVGQLVDTVIVMIVGFGGTMSWELIFNLIWSGYVVKVVYEAAATPVTYLVVNA
ncbi:MAG: queuosine precursor transporter, partial [Acidobacteria bacterium]|nr:queuosine precursor transporter [Acidobacteriota bacterium]